MSGGCKCPVSVKQNLIIEASGMRGKMSLGKRPVGMSVSRCSWRLMRLHAREYTVRSVSLNPHQYQALSTQCTFTGKGSA